MPLTATSQERALLSRGCFQKLAESTERRPQSFASVGRECMRVSLTRVASACAAPISSLGPAHPRLPHPWPLAMTSPSLESVEPASAVQETSVSAQAASPSRSLRIGVPHTADGTGVITGQTPTHPPSVTLHPDQSHHRPSHSSPSVSRRLSPLRSYAQQRQIQPTTPGHTAKAASATDVRIELQGLHPAHAAVTPAKNGRSSPSFPPLELHPSISVDDDPAFTSSCWFYRYRLRRNLTRVTFAGALSCIGALLAGFDPSLLGIFFGGLIAGVGNGVSTWLDWEKESSQEIKQRLCDDFEQVTHRIDAIKAHMRQASTAQIQGGGEADAEDSASSPRSLSSSSQATTADDDWASTSSAEDGDRDCFGCSVRHRRNALFLFIAGSLSAVGGWIGGFEASSAWGVIIGAVLSGVGNSVSTALFLEEKDEAKVKCAAREGVPALTKKVNEVAARWSALSSTAAAACQSSTALAA